jgi:hypothetical protein
MGIGFCCDCPHRALSHGRLRWPLGSHARANGAGARLGTPRSHLRGRSVEVASRLLVDLSSSLDGGNLR